MRYSKGDILVRKRTSRNGGPKVAECIKIQVVKVNVNTRHPTGVDVLILESTNSNDVGANIYINTSLEYFKLYKEAAYEIF